MSEKKPRRRKPISAAYIECILWFASNAVFQKFGKVKWARNSKTVTGRRWVSAAWEYADDPTGGVEAVFRYTHTCRNEGGYRGDSEKFIRGVRNAAGISESEVVLVEARPIHRIKCIEPEPERLTPTPPQSEPVCTAPIKLWDRPEEPPRKYSTPDRPYRARTEVDDETARQFAEETERHWNMLAFEDYRPENL